MQLPPKELLDQKQQQFIDNENKKKMDDCKMMYQLLTQTLNDAARDSDVKRIYTNKIPSSIYTMNIKNCDRFDSYMHQLNKRGITYDFVKSSVYTVDYNVNKKDLRVYGRSW